MAKKAKERPKPKMRSERMKNKRGQAKPGLDGRKVNVNSKHSKATKMKKLGKKE
jgi:hypothetical protein